MQGFALRNHRMVGLSGDTVLAAAPLLDDGCQAVPMLLQ
jgi:hypothetical protein